VQRLAPGMPAVVRRVIQVFVGFAARHEPLSAIDVTVWRFAIHEGDAPAVYSDHVGGEARSQPWASGRISLALSLKRFATMAVA
jgi:hypothetical protein